jgi:4-diphosphocytidyl-2-C-methyl-D-erythritol kinase
VRAITVNAHAKINLSLRIGAKQADGFHSVQTILQAVGMFDRLTFEARRGPFQIICTTPGVPVDRANLVWRAAQQLWSAAGRAGEPRDAIVRIEKRIPMKAGLGGGSSDAAAALLALRRIWTLRVADEQVGAVAANLGSDVPFFLVGGTAIGLGRGDEVYPLADLPRWWVVLAFPPFGIATAAAYEWLDRRRERQDDVAAPRHLAGTWLGKITPLAPLVNDLERPVTERHPMIGALTERLTGLGAAMAAMSGSGSTVFGIFRTASAARRAQRALRTAGTDAVLVRMRPRARAVR